MNVVTLLKLMIMVRAGENVEANTLLIYSGFKTIKLQISPCSYLYPELV